jgi:site-specific recombinase XerD
VSRAAEYVEASVAPNTRRAYAGDWSRFAAWCAGHGACALPADGATLALYLTDLAQKGAKVSTLTRALAAISVQHRDNGHDSPRSDRRVAAVLAGIRRTVGVAATKKAPLTVEALRTVVQALPVGMAGVRDRAVLLLGFAAALRRSEIVALDVGDLEFTTDGVKVTIRRSKTDQDGEGRVVGVPHGRKDTCPVRAVRAWLDASGIVEGAVFRRINKAGRVEGGQGLTDQVIATIVKCACQAAGVEGDFSGHSLRAGLATSAAKAGKGLDAIMRQTGHKSEHVARGYIRLATVFDANAADGLL